MHISVVQIGVDKVGVVAVGIGKIAFLHIRTGEQGVHKMTAVEISPEDFRIPQVAVGVAIAGIIVAALSYGLVDVIVGLFK